MRKSPPHILLTNYSMLEYLLIRPDDSPLFDGGIAARWRFLVLDEAHQYRGARGMEMAMLLRRLKQRLRDGGGVGDPVQEVVHGSDGLNAVIATALHELLPEKRRKVLAFADSRQEAAFFAWYAEDSYRKLRDRNLLYRALTRDVVGSEGLSIDDIASRLQVEWEQAGLFRVSDTREARRRQILTSVLREIVTDERRLSLAGVGLVRWMVALPDDLPLPGCLFEVPWNLRERDAMALLQYCLSLFLERRALELPRRGATLPWSDLSPIPKTAFGLGKPGGRRNVARWGGPGSGLVRHYLARTLNGARRAPSQALEAARSAAAAIWTAFRSVRSGPFLVRAGKDGTFRLNSEWLRLHPARPGEVWACSTCTSLTPHNIRGVCPRNGCAGTLEAVVPDALPDNHYRSLYRSEDLPPALRSEEHTAQVAPEAARRLQGEFKDGAVHLLSSSTTFEVGVSLGDLDAVFLRNVPPEPFNYVQRVGRAGRGDRAGLAVTYCRRNPHDLHHYGDPEKRVIDGTVDPPRLHLSNERIVLRHMAATVLGGFFRENRERLRTVEAFIGCWNAPRALADFNAWCRDREAKLTSMLARIVPPELHGPLGLGNGGWIERLAGDDLENGDNRLAKAEAEICSEYIDLQKVQDELYRTRASGKLQRVMDRMDTIAGMRTLNFLSRKAVIPKYGFPVDVVELDVRSGKRAGAGVVLQRDLSQAIAEYAPGARVVANKLEWESCGIRAVAGKEWPARKYRYDDSRNFRQWHEDSPDAPDRARKYLVPRFGFVTPMFRDPKPPRRRAHRVYSTRPFFHGFVEVGAERPRDRCGLRVSSASSGTLVVLCEGRGGRGFLVCRSCGAHLAKRAARHRSPSDRECRGTLEQFSLGHELVTDVVRMEFPGLRDQWAAYSVAYAVLLGAADAIGVPQNDLNVTIAAGTEPDAAAVVLYDNVPGGAGLVTQLDDDGVLGRVLEGSRRRVEGGCGCGVSCYGCLRSYRNQFAHHRLDRKAALAVLARAVGAPTSSGPTVSSGR